MESRGSSSPEMSSEPRRSLKLSASTALNFSNSKTLWLEAMKHENKPTNYETLSFYHPNSL